MNELSCIAISPDAVSHSAGTANGNLSKDKTPLRFSFLCECKVPLAFQVYITHKQSTACSSDIRDSERLWAWQ